MPKKKVISGELPHSLEAEQALLGCLLLDTKIQVEASAFLKEEDFFSESHKYIFEGMRELIAQNKPVDLVTLSDVLEKKGTLELSGGISYLTELSFVLPSSANYQRYIDIVRRNSMLRKLIKGSAEIIEDCRVSMDSNRSLANAEKIIYEVSNNADNSEMVKINDVIPEVMNRLDELSKDKSKLAGIKTNFKELDRRLNGLHGSDLIILAARPSVGKTSFAMNIVENVALNGHTCAVFSLEMGKEQLVQRMICSVAGVSMSNATKGVMNHTEWIRIMQAKKKLSKANIFIDDSSMIKPSEILSKCRRIKRKHGLDLVMIDYIQLMQPEKSKSSDNRQTEVSDISRLLKIMAKELNVPVIALSQLSRSSEKEKRRPMLSDLRESGAIEQDADIVLFIHRPEKSATEKEIAEGKVKEGVAEILIEKHRNGETGRFELFFRKECTKFVNYNAQTGEVDGGEDVDGTTATTSVTGVEGLEDLPKDLNLDVKSVDDEIF